MEICIKCFNYSHDCDHQLPYISTNYTCRIKYYCWGDMYNTVVI